ncbi:UDP-2,4-diacetamido-2,4,6-trideoxy-beta-L-altropyranose hydrolase [Vibrio sp. S4M6]|uniref:UDP-2,4-diacetamido-2,4, 6-trideoxy-beta-L-altropyranose hydrolase n=1 Tax=Vibrio sinus TaxID=2946865 RepID=UPI00202A1992|nr:UDP-2,4-diacetamido-2,4,6-trideoxy-beta-L-altropyranose hydrolase [Vibrio sinus]MCL9781547.1 UDP-2,4-diacetamido-2,4,6-trideoxy-beta-L-altropyranose hydrolase [Vibrio sinus]
MKIAFRTDSSVEIGTGHVMRCLALADELIHRGHECIFITRAHKGHLSEKIRSHGHRVEMLPSDTTCDKQATRFEWNDHARWLGTHWEQDAQQTQLVLSDRAVDWLVVDHYALDRNWEQLVGKHVSRVFVVDDLADRGHSCDVLLDQNLGRQVGDYDGLLEASCLRLVGPQYALLRPEFAELRKISVDRRQNAKVYRLFVSLGGIDRTNVTGKLLGALSTLALPSYLELDIVMGSAAPYLEDVQELAKQLSCTATVSVNVKDMAERMSRADLAIGAAGSTSWERCCLGLPAILIVIAENQHAAAGALKASGAAIIANSIEEALDALQMLISSPNSAQVLKRMSVGGSSLVSGDGCSKVVELMLGRLKV